MTTLRLEIEMVAAWVMTRVQQLRGEDRDRGSNTNDTLIWIAVIAVGALAIGAIVIAKATSKAESITLD